MHNYACQMSAGIFVWYSSFSPSLLSFQSCHSMYLFRLCVLMVTCAFILLNCIATHISISLAEKQFFNRFFLFDFSFFRFTSQNSSKPSFSVKNYVTDSALRFFVCKASMMNDLTSMNVSFSVFRHF